METATIANHRNVTALLEQYALPSPLGFGQELAPIMYRANYTNGSWQGGHLCPFGEIGINPAATCVQFGQQCFEGMKAYAIEQSRPELFRPEANFARLTRSAHRLCMPPPTASLFAEAISGLTSALENFIPNDSGQSLYLRPTLIGLDPTFAVKSSRTFAFILIASPSDAYYSDPIKIMVERQHSRAAAGGTGSEKVGGNYAGSLQSTSRSIASGFDQPLWLDASTHEYIEELSGMNFMAVVNGELHTPALTGTILPGITRASIIELAGCLGMGVVERSMPIAELLADIDKGNCTELFATGTAAIISPISEIGEADGSTRKLLDVGNMSATIKSALLNIQEGRAKDAFGWMASATDSRKLLDRLEK